MKTNRMNAMFARRNFLDRAISEHIKEKILETNLMNVMFATKDFHN